MLRRPQKNWLTLPVIGANQRSSGRRTQEALNRINRLFAIERELKRCTSHANNLILFSGSISPSPSATDFAWRSCPALFDSEKQHSAQKLEPMKAKTQWATRCRRLRKCAYIQALAIHI